MEPDKPTLIDADASIEGKLTGTEARILGRFQGEIHLKGRLHIGEGARVDAKVVADSAEIAGEFSGEIKVQRLLLLEKAKINGTLEAQTLSVREGAEVNGPVSAGESPKPKPVALAPPAALPTAPATPAR
jgi:cytoskeletal protein CcmA (bactofilin family)